MTNHWADMANSTNVVVMGANPVENHPASIAHINRARAGGTRVIPRRSMLVIDPRKTRTALQADQHIRHRPGTDIAFVNGVVRYIINWMESNPADPKSVNFFAYLNQGGSGADLQTFFSNTFNTASASASAAHHEVRVEVHGRSLPGEPGRRRLRSREGQADRRSVRDRRSRQHHALQLPEEVDRLPQPGCRGS